MGYLAPGAEAVSEFARQHSGAWLNGTCVEAAALMCALALDPVRFQMAPGDIGNYLVQMVSDWRARFPADVSPNGASNFHDAAWWLRDQGLQAIDDVGVAGDWYGEMQRGIPAGAVYLVGVTNAQALPGDEAGVHNHGLCAYGVDDAGHIVCGDPDNWRANVNMPGNPVGLSVIYTRQDFTNAQISSLTKVWRGPMVPSGWTDDGTTLKAPNGNVVVKGFRDWVLNHAWAADNLPLEAEQGINTGSIEYGNASVGPGSRQEFRFCALGWTQAWGVYVIATGQDVMALVKQQADLRQLVANLQAQLAEAQQGDTHLAAKAAAFDSIVAALATK